MPRLHLRTIKLDSQRVGCVCGGEWDPALVVLKVLQVVPKCSQSSEESQVSHNIVKQCDKSLGHIPLAIGRKTI